MLFFFIRMTQERLHERFGGNATGWKPSEKDYILVFTYVGDEFREISGWLPKYANVLFSEWLNDVGIFSLPDDWANIAINRGNINIHCEVFGQYIRCTYREL